MNVEWPEYVAKIYATARDGVGCVPKTSFELTSQDQRQWNWFCRGVLEALQDDDPEEGFVAQMDMWNSWIGGKSVSTVRVELSEPFGEIVRKVQEIRPLDDCTASQFVLLHIILIHRNTLP